MGEAMNISVTFDGKDWKIDPDPAVVTRGTPVAWRFLSGALATRRVRWTIEFASKIYSPFDLVGGAISTQTDESGGQHAASTEPMNTTTTGDYKYSIRAEDARDDKEIGQIDPRLIVTPSSDDQNLIKPQLGTARTERYAVPR